ncbi:MAG: GNAT family N-acetyltransferase [Dehalococcoidia bacterium]|nr:GNAT family N-acetyltransferase [Dehalococcoidia bacterium]
MPTPAIPAPGDHEPITGPLDVRLRPITEADLPDMLRWLADPEVVRFYGSPPESLEECRQQYLEPGVNPCWRFIIEWGDLGRGGGGGAGGARSVGEVQYWRRYPGDEYLWDAGVDIFIGEPDARGRGVGIETVRTMLRYLFEEKGVHRVTIDPEVANTRAIHVYERAGFRLDGVLRHHAFEHGEYVDTHFMSILEDEWPAAKQRWLDERA